MTGPIDVLKAARLDTLRRGLAALYGDSSPESWKKRDMIFQAIADINVAWVSRQTEEVIKMAELLAWPEGA